MTAVADNTALYLLTFHDNSMITQHIAWLQRTLGTSAAPGNSSALEQAREELTQYFCGTLTEFTTPVQLLGSPFELHVWNALRTIPFGHTQSYTEIARAIAHPTAARAVGNANGANPIAIIIPCHRVITSSGKTGGYSSGVERKQHLLMLEQKYEATDLTQK